MLFGGFIKSKSFYSYSPSSKQWTRLPDLPSKRTYHGTVVIDKTIYIVSGRGNSIIDIYDEWTKRFQTVNKIKNPRYKFGICPLKDDILIAGGMEGELEGTLQNTCFSYNTASNTFKQLRSMKSKRCGHVLANMNDECVYAIGGWNNQNGCLSSIEQFDPATEQWTIVKPKLNIARHGL